MAKKLFSPGFSDVLRSWKCGSHISTSAVSVWNRGSPRFGYSTRTEKRRKRLNSRRFPNNLILFVLRFLRKPDRQSHKPLSIHPQILAKSLCSLKTHPTVKQLAENHALSGVSARRRLAVEVSGQPECPRVGQQRHAMVRRQPDPQSRSPPARSPCHPAA